MKELSVIIPVYNAKAYLNQCVESVLCQTYEDIEVILVNDGSTDGSQEICEAFVAADKRVTFLSQDNAGPIAARHAGVKAASGRYITFVDADDFVDAKAYLQAQPFMAEGIDIIVFDIRRWYSESTCRVSENCLHDGIYKKWEIRSELERKAIWNDEINSFGIDPSLGTKLIKRDILLREYNKLIEKEFHYGEDMAVFYPALLCAESMAVTHQCYYNHHIRTGDMGPSYLTDKEFWNKLYVLYHYLETELPNGENIKHQLDMFMLRSAEFHRKALKIEEKPVWLFPFDRVAKGEHIVLYGAGEVGRAYRSQLEQLNYCKMVLWVDRDALMKGEHIVELPEKIDAIRYDRVIVAVADPTAQCEIGNYLRNRGVETSKIIYAKEMKK